jgi:glycogen debranching enzyme
VRSRVTSTTRRCAAPGWRARSGDPELAARLEREAVELRRRFNEEFWVPERGSFALALDGDKRPVDSLTSNIGHLLWSGIADEDKAAESVGHLMGDRLFSGWGVRTMAQGEGGYNPLGYHVGTVWPHDNSLIAAGLARYGHREEAARIALAMLEAAAYFRHRLPEVFAGYPRSQTGFPVEYPTACSPQAWASGAPLLFVSTLLGLEPGGGSDPVLPERRRSARAPRRPGVETRGAPGLARTAAARSRSQHRLGSWRVPVTSSPAQSASSIRPGRSA